jgi:hypothetical protein
MAGDVDLIAQWKTHGVWVPAFAGTTDEEPSFLHIAPQLMYSGKAMVTLRMQNAPMPAGRFSGRIFDVA